MILHGNVDPARAVRSNREREMAVYDSLPEPFRILAREAPENYSLIPYAEALVSGVPPPKVYALLLSEIQAVYTASERRIASGAPPPRREETFGYGCRHFP